MLEDEEITGEYPSYDDTKNHECDPKDKNDSSTIGVFDSTLNDQLQATAHEIAKAGDGSFSKVACTNGVEGLDDGLPPPLQISFIHEAIIETLNSAASSEDAKHGSLVEDMITCTQNNSSSYDKVSIKRMVSTVDADGATPSKKPRVDQATRWNNMYESLVDFKKKYGTCVVPLQNGPLGKWVDRQRQQYRKLVNGNRSALTEERRMLLESIGFVWQANSTRGSAQKLNEAVKISEISENQALANIHESSINLNPMCKVKREEEQESTSIISMPAKSQDASNAVMLPVSSLSYVIDITTPKLEDHGEVETPTKARCKRNWLERFDELCAFQKEFGHTCVPYNYKDTSLAKWVDRQRGQYKRLKDGRKSAITADKVEKLNEIGFVWSVRGPKVQVDWNIRLDQLKEYKRENNGSCLVPYNFEKNPALGKWVEKQRSQYKYFLEGKQSQITEERVKSLNEIGFVWSLHTDWKVRYEELKKYKAKYGDCFVRHTDEHKGLAKWNEKQRSQYKYYTDGKKSQLTAERVQLLNELGFVWSIRSSSINRVDWEDRYQQLLEYKQIHGDCLVPYNFDESPPLAKWVEKQRNLYKRKLDGRDSLLSDERIDKLNQIGFVWSLRERNGNFEFTKKKEKAKNKKSNIASCVEQDPIDTLELSVVKEELVAMNEHISSVVKQPPSVIENVNQELLQSADSLKDSDMEFRSKINALKEMQQQTGRIAPPEDSPLYQWLERQRTDFFSYVEKKTTTLTQDRISKLKELDVIPWLKANQEKPGTRFQEV